MLFLNVPCGWIRTAAALSQKTAQKQPHRLGQRRRDRHAHKPGVLDDGDGLVAHEGDHGGIYCAAMASPMARSTH